MIREVLFKGKTTDSGDWIDGSLVVCEEVSTIYHGMHLDGDRCKGMYYTVLSETVCQFIGETDRKGVKVFESDRVMLKGKSSGEAIKLTVKWDGRGWNIPRHLEWIEVLGSEHDQ